MAKELTAYQAACKENKDFDIMGGFPLDLAKKISRQLPFAQARELLTKFQAVLTADGREARRKGRAFETSHGDAWYALSLDERVKRSLAHQEKISKATSRDRKFAGQLPQGLRKEFYDVAKREKEFEYHSGEHTVSHNRNMKRLDEILSTPGGRYSWELQNNIAYSKRMEMGG